MDILLIALAASAGFVVAGIFFYLYHKAKSVPKVRLEELTAKYNETLSEIRVLEEKTSNLQQYNAELTTRLSEKESAYTLTLAKYASAQTQLVHNESRIAELTESLKEAMAGNHSQQEQITVSRQTIAELNMGKRSLNESLEKQGIAFDKQSSLLEGLNARLRELETEGSGLTAHNNQLREKLESQKTEIEALQRTAHLQFEQIANRILEEKSTKFTETNKLNLEALLHPLKEDIGRFRAKVDETHMEDTKQRTSLDERIKGLMEQANRVSTEANNLATALKGKPQKRGNWGELVLERILELSGLTKDREYFVQGTVKDAEGNHLRPDVRIHLPDARVIMIDSKVSLVAYDNFSATDNAEEQKIHLAKHLESTDTHIEQLSRKNYDTLGDTLDFTMMFIPIEPAYLLTIQADPSIWTRAYEKRILLVSPTNLIACLKLFSDLWKRDHQSRNAMEIVKKGEELYDKFAGFTKTFEEIGTSIKSVQDKYDRALGQLKEGKGNLVRKAISLKNLGLKSDKKIPYSLLPANEAMEDDEGEE